MADQILSCQRQNDEQGNPLNYTVEYSFDDGDGHTMIQNIIISAAPMTDPTDAAEAVSLANPIASSYKQAWLSVLNTPPKVTIDNVVGEVNL